MQRLAGNLTGSLQSSVLQAALPIFVLGAILIAVLVLDSSPTVESPTPVSTVIALVGKEPTLTPTMTATAIPTATMTATIVPTATATPIPTPTVTTAPTATPTQVPATSTPTMAPTVTTTALAVVTRVPIWRTLVVDPPAPTAIPAPALADRDPITITAEESIGGPDYDRPARLNTELSQPLMRLAVVFEGVDSSTPWSGEYWLFSIDGVRVDSPVVQDFQTGRDHITELVLPNDAMELKIIIWVEGIGTYLLWLDAL